MNQLALPLIAIDGPAGVGKTSVSRAVAEGLGYYFFSSGLIYRVIARRLLELGWRSGEAVSAGRLGQFALSIGPGGRVAVNGAPVEGDLHAEEISAAASQVSAVAEIRELSNRVQRETVVRIGEEMSFPGVVLEGRDIGSVVFPEARHKFFLTAEEEIRAQRRVLERAGAKDAGGQEAVRAAIRERDQRDATREVAPLKPAEDAIVIDTGPLTLEQVVETVLARIRAE